jgi:hypothetical protein
MMKGLFRLLLFVIIIVLIANYFWGNVDERRASKEIAEQVKELGKSIGDVLISEKEKIEDGKYDGALDKIGDYIKNLRANSDHMDVNDLKKLNELEAKKDRLKDRLQESQTDGELDIEEKDQIQLEWDQLIDEMEEFVKQQKNKG